MVPMHRPALFEAALYSLSRMLIASVHGGLEGLRFLTTFLGAGAQEGISEMVHLELCDASLD